ncbi:MAG: winged helix-turn-helix transcriptional regulator, partial [Lachnospiraceae bacterium]|nr:winged helix-turn-helix transcriptional regulator [Lachnospiraceae bacterium]
WGLLEKQENKLVPTNGFLLLTNNSFPSAVIQCAVFKGTNRAVFLDRKEYDGPLYEQIDEAYKFVLRNIRLGAEIAGLYRKDIYEIPIDSVREMIVNAVAHRSYLDSAKVQVAIYDDRLEVTSPGMLIGGVTIEELKEGYSRPRNRGIVNALTYMKNMDQWGSGIPRLMENCQKAGLREPELMEIGGNFRINMFRNTELVKRTDVNNPQDSIQAGLNSFQGGIQAGLDSIQGSIESSLDVIQDAVIDLTNTDKELLKLIASNVSLSQAEMAKILKWNIGKVKYYINKLKRRRIIERVGSSQKGYWNILIDKKTFEKGSVTE